MPIRQNEAVAILPMRISRVVAEVVVPQDLSDVRHAHRHAGMAAAGLLDGIHGQNANRVG